MGQAVFTYSELMQYEVGNSVASSYIPTQGSATTRVAETASGSGNSEVFNDSQGVLFADLKFSENGRISISNSDNSDQVILGNAGGIFYRITENNSDPITQFISSSEDLQHKFALKYNSPETTIWVDGFEIHSSAVSYALNSLSKFSFTSQGSPFYGKTKEIGYYNTILTDLELETLTSYRTWISMVNELNLNIIYNG